MQGVLISTADLKDPRFSRAQIAALVAATESDPQARILGIDYAHRPVVKARLGIPRAETTYAVQRNGDPTDVKRSNPSGGSLMETWSEKS